MMPCLYVQYELGNRHTAFGLFKELGGDKGLCIGG